MRLRAIEAGVTQLAQLQNMKKSPTMSRHPDRIAVTMDDIAYMAALQAKLRRSTRNELVSLFQEAIKRRAAGETLASIAKSYAVDISMISRL
jgi:hypothetical protein